MLTMLITVSNGKLLLIGIMYVITMKSYYPARKINNRNGLSKIVGLFSSYKMSIQIPWESQLERDFCYLLEFDKKIKNFFSQPKTFFFNYDGNEIKYTPDFYIEYFDGFHEYIEIKFSESLIKPKIANKLKLLTKYFKMNDINFRIVCEDEVRLQPRLNNIKFLSKYSKLKFEKKFNSSFETPLFHLKKIIDSEYIYAAMYGNFINFDINQELNDSIILTLELDI